MAHVRKSNLLIQLDAIHGCMYKTRLKASLLVLHIVYYILIMPWDFGNKTEWGNKGKMLEVINYCLYAVCLEVTCLNCGGNA